MTDYQIAHNLRELKDWANKGYDFVAVIDPSSWLVVKRDFEKPKQEDKLIKETIEE